MHFEEFTRISKILVNHSIYIYTSKNAKFAMNFPCPTSTRPSTIHRHPMFSPFLIHCSPHFLKSIPIFPYFLSSKESRDSPVLRKYTYKKFISPGPNVVLQLCFEHSATATRLLVCAWHRAKLVQGVRAFTIPTQTLFHKIVWRTFQCFTDM